MSLLIESISSAAIDGSSETNLIITKPTGLAVGDLMIAILGGSNDWSINVASGWTGLTQGQSIEGNQLTARVQWKIADSGDVAASNFTFTITTGTGFTGSIFRISGHDPITPINAENCTHTNTDGTTPSIACGITPTVASCLIIAVVWSAENNTVTNSGYAIAISSPTFTEHVDLTGTLNGTGRRVTICIASGIRPETTATGNLSVVHSLSESRHVGALIAVAPSSASAVFFPPKRFKQAINRASTY